MSKMYGRRSSSWTNIFTFTRRAHLSVLLPAALLSAGAGILLPATAVFFGKFFQSFSDYSVGIIEGSALMSQTQSTVSALLTIGACTFVLKGGLFALWLTFGEMQAKCIREELFQTLLEKELEWYESRTTGVGTLLAGLQT